jgi:hypothetical protein
MEENRQTSEILGFQPTSQEGISARWVWRLGDGQRSTSGVIGVFPFPACNKGLTICWSTLHHDLSHPPSACLVIYPRYCEFEIDTILYDIHDGRKAWLNTLDDSYEGLTLWWIPAGMTILTLTLPSSLNSHCQHEHSPPHLLYVWYVLPPSLGSCHLITLFSVHQHTSSLQSPHPQDSGWTAPASLSLNIEMVQLNPHAWSWSQRTARLLPTLALLPYVPFLCHIVWCSFTNI